MQAQALISGGVSLMRWTLQVKLLTYSVSMHASLLGCGAGQRACVQYDACRVSMSSHSELYVCFVFSMRQHDSRFASFQRTLWLSTAQVVWLRHVSELDSAVCVFKHQVIQRMSVRCSSHTYLLPPCERSASSGLGFRPYPQS